MTLSEERQHFKLQYFEYIYDAQAHLTWKRVGEAGAPASGGSGWRAEYFDNPNVEGVPVLVRNEAQIEHNWGTGSPGSAVPADNFSARWLRQVYLSGGGYVMRVTIDDGVRVWVGDVLVIEDWRDGEARIIEREGDLPAGRHWLRVEYYERGGQARIEVEWFKKE